jgi:DnaD/phage-associated family protein
MAWIEVHQTLSKHRKVIKAVGCLSVDRATTDGRPADRPTVDRHKFIGHLLELWWWALDNVPSDGFMGHISNAEIAIAAEWDGDPDLFAKTLIEVGFIDENPQGRWLHDWYDYAGKLLEKREKEKERSKLRRSTSGQTNGRPAVDQRTDQRSTAESCAAPYPTVPNQREREIAVQKVIQAYEETFGPLKGDPGQLMTLMDYMDKGMDVELIVSAIRKSSTAEVPLKYADKILANQLRKGILTMEDAIRDMAPKKYKEVAATEERPGRYISPDMPPEVREFHYELQLRSQRDGEGAGSDSH